MIPLSSYLLLAAGLFCIGTFGLLTRRNAIGILMAVELMANAVNINLVSFSSFLVDLVGQAFALLVLTVAAAEARAACNRHTPAPTSCPRGTRHRHPAPDSNDCHSPAANRCTTRW